MPVPMLKIARQQEDFLHDPIIPDMPIIIKITPKTRHVYITPCFASLTEPTNMSVLPIKIAQTNAAMPKANDNTAEIPTEIFKHFEEKHIVFY